MDELRALGTSDTSAEGYRGRPSEADLLLRRLLESSLQGLFLCSERFVLVEANDAFLRVCGRSRDELRRGELEWPALVAPAHREVFEQAREKLRATGELQPLELLFRGPGGHPVPTLVSGTRLPQGCAVFVQDLSESKRRAAALRQSERLLSLLLESVKGAVFTVGPDRTLVAATPGRTLGLAAGTGVGSPVDEALRDRPQLRQVIARAFEGASADAHLLESGVALEVKARPLPQDEPALGSGVGGVTGVAVDVTDLHRAHEERVRRERHFTQVQRLESVGLLATGLAFEFNNLLAGVLANLSSVLQASPVHPAAEALKDAMHSAERAAGLTKQLLATARHSQGPARNVDLSSMVRELSPLLEAATPRRARIVFELGSALPPVLAHLDPLRQTLLSLVASAIEATTSKGGVVRVATGLAEVLPGSGEMMVGGDRLSPGWYVQLTVADDGSGLDPAGQRSLPDSDATAQGRTLGLTAVLAHVRAVRGGVRVHSDDDGTRVEVLLPTSDEPEVEHPDISVPPPSPSRSVLVVDDDAVVRRAAVRIIEAMGIEAREARDGDEAVALLERDPSPLGLVLLDFAMPGMNGEQTLRALRAKRPNLRVLLCSGYTEEDATWRLEEGELTGFVPKPFTAKELQRAVRFALEGNPAATPPVGVKKLRKTPKGS
jgi:two-component system, cell cycle sensor histidine kinase and response regulator CckA